MKKVITTGAKNRKHDADRGRDNRTLNQNRDIYAERGFIPENHQIRGADEGAEEWRRKTPHNPKENRSSMAELPRYMFKFAQFLLDLLYPPRCPICDAILRRKDGLCCEHCAARLPWVREPVCMKCGKPVPYAGQEYCDDCRKYPHNFDRGAAAFTYTGEMRHSVYRMKTQNRRDYLDFYADAMVQALQPHLMFWKPEQILPVPMHRKKKQKRGYNQSELLAVRIGRLTGIPVEKKALKCTRAVTAQKTLDRKKRLNNLHGSFCVENRAVLPKRVLVIDDIYTTGSTMDEISRILKNAGVSAVYFQVLCIGKGKKAVCTEENVCYTDERIMHSGRLESMNSRKERAK